MTDSMLNRRGLIGGVAATAGLTAVAAGNNLVGTAQAQAAPKTFVLVSGAFLGGWCWRRVVDLLEKKGHKVFSPSLAGLAEHSHLMSKSIDLDAHISDIVNVITWESLTGVCLVAHSYGGFPASGALEQIGENVASIVWLDAFKPESGQKVFDLTPERFREPLIASMNKGESAFPTAAKPPSFVVGEKDAAFFASKVTPQPIGTYMQPLKLSGAREKVAKKTYIRIPRYPSPVFDKAFSDCKADMSWSTYNLADSGHVAMLDAPERLTEMLEHAA